MSQDSDAEATRPTLPRVAPPRISAGISRAPRPADDGSGAREAYRQTGFLLGEDVELVVAALTLERDIAEASSGARYRKHEVAAPLATWSRSWLMRLQALHATECGNYTAAIGLVRSAVELHAAARLLIDEGSEPWKAWLTSGGIGLEPALHATELRLHPYRAAEVLAGNDELGAIYRLATDLSMGHFGATALLAGEGSSATRVAVTFGDRDFHLAQAQLVLGWLLSLSRDAVLTTAAPSSPFAEPEGDRVAGIVARIDRTLGAGDRCRAEIIEHQGAARHLIHNWRRRAGTKAERILL